MQGGGAEISFSYQSRKKHRHIGKFVEYEAAELNTLTNAE